jgi:hypothetical protein
MTYDDSEVAAIHETVDAYLKAIKTGKTEHFERAFYPFAHIINADTEDPDQVKLTRDEFAGRIAKRHVENMLTEEVAHGVSVSYVGAAANVRVDFELRIGENTVWGTDYFNMVKHGGVWRITQKIYAVTH